MAVQSLIYEDDLAYQPDGWPAVDASASRVCDIPDKEPRPCGGWKNPAGTVSSDTFREHRNTGNDSVLLQTQSQTSKYNYIVM